MHYFSYKKIPKFTIKNQNLNLIFKLFCNFSWKMIPKFKIKNQNLKVIFKLFAPLSQKDAKNQKNTKYKWRQNSPNSFINKTLIFLNFCTFSFITKKDAKIPKIKNCKIQTDERILPNLFISKIFVSKIKN